MTTREPTEHEDGVAACPLIYEQTWAFGVSGASAQMIPSLGLAGRTAQWVLDSTAVF